MDQMIFLELIQPIATTQLQFSMCFGH